MPTEDRVTVQINEHTLVLPRAEAHSLVVSIRHAMKQGDLVPISPDTVIIATPNTTVSVNARDGYEDPYRALINSPAPDEGRKNQKAWVI